MPTFVRVGKYRINLDQVLYISEEDGGTFIYFARMDPLRLSYNDGKSFKALLSVYKSTRQTKGDMI